ncbi:MAG: hypothetical protein HGA98_02705, partial [Deltaproteobacteria bacterium]|nr:hypothetical protein [Deltaproteobacteria bacterium]
CVRRLKKSRVRRPLLESGDPEQRVRELFAEREYLYESVGEKVDTEGLSPEEVAEVIAEKRLRPPRLASAG